MIRHLLLIVPCCLQCDPSVLEFDPVQWELGARRHIPQGCAMVEVPGSAVPCTVNFKGMGLPSLQGGSRGAILAELMPALEEALGCAAISEEDTALAGTLHKQMTALDKTAEEKIAAHLIAARAHLKQVLALATVHKVRLYLGALADRVCA
jgi:hypothetical protein